MNKQTCKQGMLKNCSEGKTFLGIAEKAFLSFLIVLSLQLSFVFQLRGIFCKDILQEREILFEILEIQYV